jgi:hypothetical protein
MTEVDVFSEMVTVIKSPTILAFPSIPTNILARPSVHSEPDLADVAVCTVTAKSYTIAVMIPNIQIMLSSLGSSPVHAT